MILKGDCLDKMKEMDSNSIDLIYLDPPFFTQEVQISKNRKTGIEYKFNDRWNSLEEYLKYMEERLNECKRVLKITGSIFLHCDNKASHYLKVIMDRIYGYENFQSEIIWYYKRWSNSKKGLLNNHQNILFYSKTEKFKFNNMYNDYSHSTNVEQIFQKREKDSDGRSIYKLDDNGKEIINEPKKGVPMNDVWEIPFLNPTAKERVGYPTQKPIELIDRIIKLVTDKEDIVLDPFAGSGTTLVSAKLLGRKYIGIDISDDAINLINERLKNPVKTNSNVVNGKIQSDLDSKELQILKNIDAVPIKRNKGIDGVLKKHYKGKPVFIKIQKKDECLEETKQKLMNAKRAKDSELLLIVQTEKTSNINQLNMLDVTDKYMVEEVSKNLKIITLSSLRYQVDEVIKKFELN